VLLLSYSYPPLQEPHSEGKENQPACNQHFVQLGRHKAFDPSQMRSSYTLLISSIVPRPIALTSTCGGPGGDNLAPFSYFNVIAHDPPTIALGISKARAAETTVDVCMRFEGEQTS
jgi:hypothetical protein